MDDLQQSSLSAKNTEHEEELQREAKTRVKKWRRRVTIVLLLLLLLMAGCSILEGSAGSVISIVVDLDEDAEKLLGDGVYEGDEEDIEEPPAPERPRYEEEPAGTVPRGTTVTVVDRQLPPIAGASSASFVVPGISAASSIGRPPTRHSSTSSSYPRSFYVPPREKSSSSSSSSSTGAVIPYPDPDFILTVKLRAPGGRIFTPRYHFENGRGTISMDARRFTPGFYTLILTRTDLVSGESNTTEQEFPWGVLAMNTDQDRYRPGETGNVSIGVLDEYGEIVCNADLTLTVLTPSGATSVFSTDDGGIRVTGTCGVKIGGLLTPDYEAEVPFGEEGIYKLTLLAERPTGTHRISSLDSDVTVTADPAVIYTRTAATRLWPVEPSTMEIKAWFKDGYTGVVEERVPLGFVISSLTPSGTVIENSTAEESVIRWEGSWAAGETATFSYTYDAPDISPEFYLMGPIELRASSFEQSNANSINTQSSALREQRSWQIANDDVSRATTYKIGADVVAAGGGEDARSTRYALADTIGEATIGWGRSDTYDLNAGYRQSVVDAYMSFGCGDLADLGSIPFTGQANANLTCTVNTDNEAGYNLTWKEGLSTSNLVGHWKLDESVAGAFADSSGNGNVGTGYGAAGGNNTPQPSTAVYSPYYSVRSVDFDGADDYIEVASSSELKLTNVFTVGLWAKAHSLSQSQTYLFNKSNDYAVIFEYVDNTVEFFSADYTGSDPRTGSQIPLADTNWHHITYTYDGATWSGYLDGVQMFSTLRTFSLPITNDAITLGSAAAHVAFFDGNLDDIRIYSAALTQGQIAELASKGPPGAMAMSGSQVNTIPAYRVPMDGLVGHWKMDEMSAGSSVLDWSGNNNDGTPVGDTGGNAKPQPSTSVPAGTNFGNMRSLNFDGTDDYINVTNATALNPVAQVTVSAWIKTSNVTQNYAMFITKSIEGNDGWNLRFNGATGRPMFTINVDGSYIDHNDYSTNIAVVNNSWAHVVGIYDGTAVKTYVNGELSGSYSRAGSITNAAAPIRIGKRADGYVFSGNIDDVRVYNRALSAEEIKALYATPQAWSVAATTSQWGGRLASASTDTHAKWGTDGASSNWLNVGDGSYPVVSRASRTGVSGSTEVFNFRTEIGATRMQAPGVYRKTVQLTVTAL